MPYRYCSVRHFAADTINHWSINQITQTLMCIHGASPPGELNKFSSARKMKSIRNVLWAPFVRKGIKEVSEMFCRDFSFWHLQQRTSGCDFFLSVSWNPKASLRHEHMWMFWLIEPLNSCLWQQRIALSVQMVCFCSAYSDWRFVEQPNTHWSELLGVGNFSLF